MAPTASDCRSSQAPQRCSETVGSVVRPMLVIIGAPGSFEGRPMKASRVRSFPSVPFVKFVYEAGHTHSNLGKGSYDAGAPYSVGVAAVAAG